MEHWFNHSRTSDHWSFLENVSLTFIDKTDASNSLKREDCWRCTLKTIAPFRLDTKGRVLQVYYQYFAHWYFDRTGTIWGQRFSDLCLISIVFLFLKMFVSFVFVFIIIIFTVVILVIIFIFTCFYYCQ